MDFNAWVYMGMKNFIGIIGGSGVYQMEGLSFVADHDVETPFGRPSSPIKEFDYDGKKVFFLARHSHGHTISPSEINYRANIFSLKLLGVKNIISVSAVGSLREDLHPGMVFYPDSFIDWTKGLRRRTFFECPLVGHSSNAYPINKELSDLLEESTKEQKIEYLSKGSYICIEGPQFSTLAESHLFRSFKASVVGMTNVPESFLAKEANINYATMALITDYDCWKEDPCQVDEIMKVMKSNYSKAQKILLHFLQKFSENQNQLTYTNEKYLVSNVLNLTSEQIHILRTLES